MKAKNYLSLLALTAGVLALNITTATAQYVDSVASLKNRAVAASPRAKEVFPWLSRPPAPRIESCCPKVAAKNELSEVRNNRAPATSPRMRELYPELARGAEPVRKRSAVPMFEMPASVRNNAIASSPRAREEFPALSRGARLEKETAEASASRLAESGK